MAKVAYNRKQMLRRSDPLTSLLLVFPLFVIYQIGVLSMPSTYNGADLITFALQGVIQKGTGTAAGIGRPAAGKTGTAEKYVDAWFCGYTPQLAACVWVGYPKGEISMINVEGFSSVFGGSLPAEALPPPVPGSARPALATSRPVRRGRAGGRSMPR